MLSDLLSLAPEYRALAIPAAVIAAAIFATITSRIF